MVRSCACSELARRGLGRTTRATERQERADTDTKTKHSEANGNSNADGSSPPARVCACGAWEPAVEGGSRRLAGGCESRTPLQPVHDELRPRGAGRHARLVCVRGARAIA